MCDNKPTEGAEESPKQYRDSQYRTKQDIGAGRLGFATGSSYNPSLQSLIAQRESLLDSLVKVQEAIRLLQSF